MRVLLRAANMRRQIASTSEDVIGLFSLKFNEALHKQTHTVLPVLNLSG